MEWIFVWVAACVIVAIIAENRNRFGCGWFVLSFFISPLLSLILVLALKEPFAVRTDERTRIQNVQTLAELGLTHKLEEEKNIDDDDLGEIDVEELRNGPATDRQYDYLFSLGWEGRQNLTKGQASQLITRLKG